MKKLETINLARLSVLEFGQHVKSIATNINLLGAGFVTDTTLSNYLSVLNTKSIDYDKAMLQIAKSDETAKIVLADDKRDTAIKATLRQLSVFELSEDPLELLSYESLNTLFKVYKDVQTWNFEEESNGIDNLVNDLKSTKYAAHITKLKMTAFVTRIETNNTAFKTLFAGRTQETVGKVVYDVKVMRADIKTVYNDMAEYVLSMSKAKDIAQYNSPLNVINTVRKYYADLLAKRKPAKKGETVVPIEPMP